MRPLTPRACARTLWLQDRTFHARTQESALVPGLLANGPTSNDGPMFAALFTATGRAAREHPAFERFVEQARLAEPWRCHGPPDFRGATGEPS